MILTREGSLLSFPAVRPEPISGPPITSPFITSESPQLSGCVHDSVARFSRLRDVHKIEPADMFVDIAKYGRGSWVARLRKWGIGANEIDEIVDRTGVSVVAPR